MSTPTAKSEYARSIFLECALEGLNRKLEEAKRERDAAVFLGKVAIVKIGVIASIAFFWMVFR